VPTASANTTANDRAAEAAIREVVETWHRATAAGDVARVLSLMTEDAIFLAPERAPMQGRQAFERALRDLLATHTITSKGQVREVVVSGDLAYAWTDLTVAITAREGSQPVERSGPTLSIFRRQADGRWLLVRDANMLASEAAELELKVDDLERELMADGPGGD
jgi:uncharacterized protein (TIGR02246 family)